MKASPAEAKTRRVAGHEQDARAWAELAVRRIDVALPVIAHPDFGPPALCRIEPATQVSADHATGRPGGEVDHAVRLWIDGGGPSGSLGAKPVVDSLLLQLDPPAQLPGRCGVRETLLETMEIEIAIVRKPSYGNQRFSNDPDPVTLQRAGKHHGAAGKAVRPVVLQGGPQVGVREVSFHQVQRRFELLVFAQQ